MTASRPRLFTIPPDVAFLPALVRAIDQGGFPVPGSPAARAEELPHWTLLVPTRRASRALAQAFVDLGSAPSRLLPRIRPIGDIDEDMIAIDPDGATPGEHAIAPAISPLAREFLLVKLIGEWAKTHAHERLARDLSDAPAQAQGLARSLALLIDQLETEEKSTEALSALYDIDLAIHRQALIGLIDIVREGLPRELSRLGLIGPAQRRSALIRWQARNWRESPPRFPVIAAGSTGSIPATAELLKTVAHLDSGAVILPGLDSEMDEASWRELGSQHAQYGLKLLLEGIGTVREEVEPLPGLIRSERGQARVWLGSELMRPPGAAHEWRDTIARQRERMAEALGGVTLIETQSRQEEAVVIAVILRGAIEQDGRTAALVTPDRDLARRVSAELERWNIAADDSGGEPLIRTPPGRLVQLALDCALRRFDSPSIASLLHHPLATFGRAGNVLRDAREFELAVLRSGLPRSGLGALAGAARVARRHAHEDEYVHSGLKRLSDWQWDRMEALGGSLVQCLTPLAELAAATNPKPLKAQLETIVACVDLATRGEHGSSIWQDRAGETLWMLFRALLDEADHHPPAVFPAIAQLIGHYLRTTPVRAPFAPDARIAILGLLEARLIRADVTVLGGLNEGKWPAQADPGPWLNRPMCEALGVQAPERHIGLTAHDFAQAFGGPVVYLTWSKRIGADPVVPSRSIVTAKMLIEAAGLADVLARGEAILSWARGLDVPARVAPVGKPKPKPPIDARPKRLSVTDIERLIRDPYAIYARKILRLEPLPGLAETSGHALRGTLIHKALSRYPEFLNRHANAYDALIAAGREAFRSVAEHDDIMSFWWPRFERIARWFADEDAALRQTVQASFVELRGKIEFDIAGETFTLAATADRIDLLAGRRARIIDYKTGTVPSPKKVEVGFKPQLTLEAAMLDAGGFPLNQTAETRELLYIRLSGAEPAGELCPLANFDVAAVSQSHLAELKILLWQYTEPDRAYLPRLAMEREKEPGEFDHLSRLDEWALSGEAR